jgi:hypothetical protein
VQKQLGCSSSRDLFDPFSKEDAITLLQVGIKTGPLFLVPETRLSAEELGSTEVGGKALTMEVLKQLIGLVRRHVSVVVCEFSQSLPFYSVTPLPSAYQSHTAPCCINHVD